jgi:hypothetical protein
LEAKKGDFLTCFTSRRNSKIWSETKEKCNEMKQNKLN